MPQKTSNFFAQFVGVVMATLMTVVVTAFLTIPWSLQMTPGDQPTQVAAGERHMT